MALPTKTDYIGLAATGIELRSNSLGKSAQYLEKVGANGDIVADEVFGTVAAPSCDYAITAKTENFTAKLGKVNAASGTYALSSFTVSTSAGGEPTISANAVQIEDGATQTACVYATTAITLNPEWHAQNFGAFTYTESASLALQDCSFTAECSVNVATVNGTPKASDATGGKETVTATFWSSSDTEPSVTDAAGWKRSAPMTCTGSDGDLFTWTATWTKHLTSSAS